MKSPPGGAARPRNDLSHRLDLRKTRRDHMTPNNRLKLQFMPLLKRPWVGLLLFLLRGHRRGSPVTQRQLMLNKQVSEEETLLLDTNKCTIMEKITKKMNQSGGLVLQRFFPCTFVLITLVRGHVRPSRVKMMRGGIEGKVMRLLVALETGCCCCWPTSG